VDNLITTQPLGGLQLREMCHFAFAAKPGAVKVKGKNLHDFEVKMFTFFCFLRISGCTV
jgi:hypothetical protein